MEWPGVSIYCDFKLKMDGLGQFKHLIPKSKYN